MYEQMDYFFVICVLKLQKYTLTEHPLKALVVSNL